MARRKILALLIATSATLWVGTCITDIRDAIVGGALDYISGTTTGIFDAFFPLASLLAPAA